MWDDSGSACLQIPPEVTRTRVQHRSVEQTVEVPVHLPPGSAAQGPVQTVEVPVPMTQEEVVHVPKVITQNRVRRGQNGGGMVVSLAGGKKSVCNGRGIRGKV